MNNDTIELLYIIFKYLQIKSDIFTFRLLNNVSNNIFKTWIYELNTDNMYAKSTFVNIKLCNACNMYNINYIYKTFIYNCEYHPQRILHYCNNVNCFFKCVKLFLIDIQIDDLFPFFQVINKNNKNKNTILINNLNIEDNEDNEDIDDSILIDAIIEPQNMIYHKKEFYILINFYNAFYKYEKIIDIKALNINFEIKNNIIFKWFLKKKYTRLYIKGETLLQ